jgi:hypothetical protein
MAYQHTQRSQFLTHSGVDKLFGAQQMAEHLGLEVEQCVGAGDTEMDSFLAGVGLALEVGPLELAYRGKQHTIKLSSSQALGEVLFRLADLVKAKAGR